MEMIWMYSDMIKRNSSNLWSSLKIEKYNTKYTAIITQTFWMVIYNIEKIWIWWEIWKYEYTEVPSLHWDLIYLINFDTIQTVITFKSRNSKIPLKVRAVRFSILLLTRIFLWVKLYIYIYKYKYILTHAHH